MTTRELSYMSCNIDTIIAFVIIFPSMILCILVIKLFVIGEIHKDRNGCWPISYYFGDSIGCKKQIQKNIDGFEVLKSEDISKIITESILETNETIKQISYHFLKEKFLKYFPQ